MSLLFGCCLHWTHSFPEEFFAKFTNVTNDVFRAVFFWCNILLWKGIVKKPLLNCSLPYTVATIVCKPHVILPSRTRQFPVEIELNSAPWFVEQKTSHLCCPLNKLTLQVFFHLALENFYTRRTHYTVCFLVKSIKFL